MIREDERYRGIQRVLVVTLALNLAVALAKVVAGLVFNLLSLTADGVHSGIDGLNNVVGLVAVFSASRPPDSQHPYGHRKFETFAALAIGLFLLAAGVGLVQESLERRQGGAVPRTGLATYALVVATIVVNALVTRYERRRGEELKSEFLLADAQHTATDVLVSCAVLVAMVAVDLKAGWLDLWCALAIAGFILYTAVRLVLKGLGVLADQAAIDVAEIRRVALAVPGVLAIHKVRTRGSEGYVFADLHVQVDPQTTVREGHKLAHEVVDAIVREIPGVHDVVTHLEPFGDVDAT